MPQKVKRSFTLFVVMIVLGIAAAFVFKGTTLAQTLSYTSSAKDNCKGGSGGTGPCEEDYCSTHPEDPACCPE